MRKTNYKRTYEEKMSVICSRGNLMGMEDRLRRILSESKLPHPAQRRIFDLDGEVSERKQKSKIAHGKTS